MLRTSDGPPRFHKVEDSPDLNSSFPNSGLATPKRTQILPHFLKLESGPFFDPDSQIGFWVRIPSPKVGQILDHFVWVAK